MSQNSLAVSRRVQLWLLGLLVFTIYIFWTLLPSVGIGLTVAAVCHPLYRRLYRFFQVSEKSDKSETIFATGLTVAVAATCLFFLFIPFWILVGNIEEIKTATMQVLAFVEKIEKNVSGLLGTADEDGDAQPQTASATDGAISPSPAANAPRPANAADTPDAPGTGPDDGTTGANGGGPAADRPTIGPSAPIVAAPPAEPATEGPAEPAAELPTGSGFLAKYRPQMIIWVQDAAVDSLKAVPAMLLKFFVFALTLYLGIRYGAMIYRRVLFSLEIQTREIVQRMGTSTYRTLYAIYIVHFSTVVVTFLLAFPMCWVLRYEQVLMIATTCAIFQLIPFIGPTLIVVALMIYELTLDANPNLAANMIWLFIYGYGVMCLAPDWILRPYLMSKQSGINPLIMWLGFFGGIAIMGPAGFVFGPLLLALLIEAVNIVLERFPDPLLQLQKQKGNSVFVADTDDIEKMLEDMGETEFRKVVAHVESQAKLKRTAESGIEVPPDATPETKSATPPPDARPANDTDGDRKSD